MATCLWFQFSDGHFSRLKVADSREGMFSHDDTIVTDSIFVAESKNFCSFDLCKNRRGRINKVGRFGFRNYLNPALLSGVTFKGFTGKYPEGGSLYALVSWNYQNLQKGPNLLIKIFEGIEARW